MTDMKIPRFPEVVDSPKQGEVVPSRESTWKVKPYVPSLAMRMAQARAKEHQPPLKSLTSDAKIVVYYEK